MLTHLKNKESWHYIKENKYKYNHSTHFPWGSQNCNKHYEHDLNLNKVNALLSCPSCCLWVGNCVKGKSKWMQMQCTMIWERGILLQLQLLHVINATYWRQISEDLKFSCYIPIVHCTCHMPVTGCKLFYYKTASTVPIYFLSCASSWKGCTCWHVWFYALAMLLCLWLRLGPN